MDDKYLKEAMLRAKEAVENGGIGIREITHLGWKYLDNM